MEIRIGRIAPLGRHLPLNTQVSNITQFLNTFMHWQIVYSCARYHVCVCRSKALQRAELQVQQIYHSQRSLSLLPGWKSQRGTEKQDS